MKLSKLLGLTFALCGLTCVTSSFADGETTKAQKDLQADLEHSLIAPCCWNMTVDQHDSPMSRQVRTKIEELVKQGKTKDEVLTHFTSQPKYGERILATPAQNNLLGKFAYWAVPLVFAIGLFVVFKTIRSLSSERRPAEKAAKKQKESKPASGEWDKIVEEELKSLD